MHSYPPCAGFVFIIRAICRPGDSSKVTDIAPYLLLYTIEKELEVSIKCTFSYESK